MQARVVGLAIVVLLAIAGSAAATPAQELEDARALFRAREFERAIPPLNYLLYPTPRLSARHCVPREFRKRRKMRRVREQRYWWPSALSRSSSESPSP